MDRDDLLYLIRTMDSAYLKHSKEESDRTLEKGKKKGGKIGGG